MSLFSLHTGPTPHGACMSLICRTGTLPSAALYTRDNWSHMCPHKRRHSSTGGQTKSDDQKHAKREKYRRSRGKECEDAVEMGMCTQSARHCVSSWDACGINAVAVAGSPASPGDQRVRQVSEHQPRIQASSRNRKARQA